MTERLNKPARFSDDPEKQKLYSEAVMSLERMQQFDTATLPRTDELGSTLNFQEAVGPANDLLDLYRQLPVEVLESLSTQRIKSVLEQSNNDYSLLKQVLDFSTDVGNPRGERDTKVTQIKSAYDPCFEKLFPLIAYAVQKSTDFARLEREARAMVQSVSDRADELQDALTEKLQEAESVLVAIRKVASEQGVTQQAVYFKQEADEHESEAAIWLNRTVWLTIGLGLYAALTLILHKVPYLSPASSYETAQLAISKVLIFATISFFLLLAARNYSAHRHNCVVNRHRQNALRTYEALVRSAGDEGNRDIVLTKASECIFSAQPTAFSKLDGGEGSYSMVTVSPGNFKSSSGT